jgi:hypothetical protein
VNAWSILVPQALMGVATVALLVLLMVAGAYATVRAIENGSTRWLVVSAGWYIAIVELVPASMRPYIGGSQLHPPAGGFWHRESPARRVRVTRRLGGSRRVRQHPQHRHRVASFGTKPERRR